MSERNGYIVVFRYTDKAGGYAGITTISEFASKEDFEAQFAEQGGAVVGNQKILGEEEIIDEGCTRARAEELVGEVGLRTYARAAVQEATDPDGNVNMELARKNFANAAIMFGLGEIKRI